ncbi:SRPBCC family protein [Nocardioides caldifontis]|uniref:SRPBCC family protein n=1 Tax=Nocardioides caldifontis TaxID=2588938 RepID=UPI0013969B72|nr:SRPBCC family protein [Nocardioides caldifontis]
MKLEHEFVVPLDVDEAWNLLVDIERVAVCFPGAALSDVDGDSFSGTVRVRIGPVAMQYRGVARFILQDRGSGVALIEAQGRETGGAGGAKADVRLHLTDDGVHATKVTVETELSLTGRPAQFGRGVIADVSDGLLTQFVRNLEAQVTGGDTADGDDDRVGSFSPSHSADVGAVLLRALYRRLGPWAAGGAFVAVALLLSRRCRRAARHRRQARKG